MPLEGRVSAKPERGVLVTGGSGFIGSRVVAALERAGVQPWRLSRVPGEGRVVPGDLTDLNQLAEAVAGVEVIVHCAAYIGPDEDTQRRVNIEGTRNLITVARASGVRSLIYVSTTGVYGGVLGTGRAEGEILMKPGSSSARSRAVADSLVTEAGWTAVRPNLVFGPGDRRTITALLAGMVRLDAWIGDPGSLVSVIDVRTLGRLVAALVSIPEPPKVLHAAYPRPVRVRELVEPVFDRARMALPERSLSLEEVLRSARSVGFSSRQVSMVANDNWYNSDLIWKMTGLGSRRTALLDVGTVNYYAACLRSFASVSPNGPSVGPAGG